MTRVAFWVALACALPALAQQPPDAGSVLRDVQKPLPPAPAKPQPRLEIEQRRPALAPQPTLRFVLKRVRITGNTVFSESALQEVVRDFVGKEIGFADLEEAAVRITRYYRERGYLVARAYLPQQEIRDGVVEIAVLEGRFGKSELNNRSRVSDATIRRFLRPLEGGSVDEQHVERQLLLLNDLPGMGTASAALRPGERVGETALALSVGEAPLIGGGVELDNYGSHFTGQARLTGEFDLFSPLGYGDSASAQGITSTGLDLLRLAYQLPVGGHGLRLGGAYSQLSYKLGREFESLQAHGTAKTESGNVSYPFVRAREANLNGQLAFTRRQFDDHIDSSDTDTQKSTDAAGITLGGDLRDRWLGGGVTSALATLVAGRLDIETPAARTVDEATAQTQGTYRKLVWNAQRVQRLAERWSGVLGVSGQVANKNLDSSEKFAPGGPFGLRAYPLGEAAADEGVMLNAEARYDVQPGSLQAIAFYDAGSVHLNHQAPPGTTVNHRSLADVGTGLDWHAGRTWFARLVVALGNRVAQSAPDRHPRIWAQAAARF